jgi:hypothetical protein
VDRATIAMRSEFLIILIYLIVYNLLKLRIRNIRDALKRGISYGMVTEYQVMLPGAVDLPGYVAGTAIS